MKQLWERDYKVKEGPWMFFGYSSMVIPEPIVIGDTMYISSAPPKPVCVELPSGGTMENFQ